MNEKSWWERLSAAVVIPVALQLLGFLAGATTVWWAVHGVWKVVGFASLVLFLAGKFYGKVITK